MQPLPRVGPVTLVRRVGAGRLGVVYEGAFQGVFDGARVAVTVVRREFAEDPQFRARFRREIRLVRRVHSAHTVRLIAADVDFHPPYIVTELLDGPTLLQDVDASGPLDEESLHALAVSLGEALRAIHEAGTTHRGLKPAAVFLTSTGPKVVDFGIMPPEDVTSLAQRGGGHGSDVGYLSPEQLHGAAPTEACDVFAWAATVAFAATGRAPFGDGTIAAIAGRVAEEPPDLDGVPEALRDLLSRALDKEPEKRPTVDALLRALTGPIEADEAATKTGASVADEPPAETGASDEPVEEGTTRTLATVQASAPAPPLEATPAPAPVRLVKDVSVTPDASTDALPADAAPARPTPTASEDTTVLAPTRSPVAPAAPVAEADRPAAGQPSPVGHLTRPIAAVVGAALIAGGLVTGSLYLSRPSTARAVTADTVLTEQSVGSAPVVANQLAPGVKLFLDAMGDDDKPWMLTVLGLQDGADPSDGPLYEAPLLGAWWALGDWCTANGRGTAGACYDLAASYVYSRFSFDPRTINSRVWADAGSVAGTIDDGYTATESSLGVASPSPPSDENRPGTDVLCEPDCAQAIDGR